MYNSPSWTVFILPFRASHCSLCLTIYIFQSNFIVFVFAFTLPPPCPPPTHTSPDFSFLHKWTLLNLINYYCTELVLSTILKLLLFAFTEFLISLIWNFPIPPKHQQTSQSLNCSTSSFPFTQACNLQIPIQVLDSCLSLPSFYSALSRSVLCPVVSVPGSLIH